MTTLNQLQPPLHQRAAADRLANQIRLFETSPMVGSLLNAVPDIFVVLNDNRQIVFANESFRRFIGVKSNNEIYGLRPGEAVACLNAFMTPGGCGTTEFCRQCGARRSILGALIGTANTQECHIQRQSGEPLELRVWSKPLVLEGQRFIAFSMQDISAEKHRQTMERIFFHDILNSASFITGLIDVWQVEEEDGADLDLEEFRRELDIASRAIIDEIHAQRILVEAEASVLEIARSFINVPRFVGQLVEKMRQHPIARNVHLKLATTGEAVLQSDPTLLGRVLVNMLKNAVEASCGGGNVTLSYTLTTERITFQVHNDTYIPPEIQTQIFHRSFSTKGRGRGLGTYSIKLLSERYLNGEAWFETGEDSGTSFFVSYPLMYDEVI